jgi:hypothetical protein
MFETAAADAQNSVLTEFVRYGHVPFSGYDTICQDNPQHYAPLDAGYAQQMAQFVIYPDDDWDMWNIDQGCSVHYAGARVELQM